MNNIEKVKFMWYTMHTITSSKTDSTNSLPCRLVDWSNPLPDKIVRPNNTERPFPPGVVRGGRKIMIGRQDRYLLNLGVGHLLKCNGLAFSFEFHDHKPKFPKLPNTTPLVQRLQDKTTVLKKQLNSIPCANWFHYWIGLPSKLLENIRCSFSNFW